jgi:hypothetical protein
MRQDWFGIHEHVRIHACVVTNCGSQSWKPTIRGSQPNPWKPPIVEATIFTVTSGLPHNLDHLISLRSSIGILHFKNHETQNWNREHAKPRRRQESGSTATQQEST